MVVIWMIRKLDINLINLLKELICSEIICATNLKVLVCVILDNRRTVVLINSNLCITFIGNENNLARLTVLDLIANIQTMLK